MVVKNISENFMTARLTDLTGLTTSSFYVPLGPLLEISRRSCRKVTLSTASYLRSFLRSFPQFTSSMHEQSPRKNAGDRTIHTTQVFRESVGNLYLCDLGEAVIGDEHEGPAMPTQYRAPEVILGMKWGHAIDMWSVGLMAWDMMQPRRIFKIYDPENEFLNNAHHLAAIVALLGPPPLEFLERSQESWKYWDENGVWRDIVPIPTDRTLEALATKPEDDEERDLFINFITGLLDWLPEERTDSFKIFSHLWIYRDMDIAHDDAAEDDDGSPRA